ncbi:MAG: hypothetical protein Q9187_000651 [Circinaria calcarea]
MAFNPPLHQQSSAKYPLPRTSPLRQSSNASTTSSAHSNFSNPYPPSRTSTISSAASSGYQYNGAGHKRGSSEAGMSPSAAGSGFLNSNESSPVGTYRNTRQSLRPLPQAPNGSPPATYKTVSSRQSRGQILNEPPKFRYDDGVYTRPLSTSQPNHPHAHSMTLSRADSTSGRPHIHHANTNPHASVLSPPDLTTLKNSTTSHLLTLSKFAQNGSKDDLSSMTVPAPSVVGLLGRRQLKRTDSTRGSKGTVALTNGSGYAWAGRNWMDQQRQFLQAYEYLCHIGEAKEWIEDIIHKPIPPIVQLEEALRDGVTLAEIVQVFTPNRTLRIFRHEKLQFRHSDNIALFFRFLGEIELPELFRFELIDLYEKKNIPKVIYCIHALSWLLYRNGMVGFRIGNLVGQLQFEDHELEEMQKGLDRAGVNMPSFSGMGASFGAEPEPEPEPEPVESEEDRIQRELAENESIIVDLQTQIRGALIRMRLGDKMQGLWDAEEMLVDLQARIRGDWARQIAEYRLTMKRFATSLQSASRGYLVRARQQGKEDWWKSNSAEILTLQSLIRARRAREQTSQLKSSARRHESGVRYFQAAIRGALERNRINEQYEDTLAAETGVENLQAAARGLIERQRRKRENLQLQQSSDSITTLQAAARGMASRSYQLIQDIALRNNEALWCNLQAAIRGMAARSSMSDQNFALQRNTGMWRSLQSASRGMAVRCHLSSQDAAIRSNDGLLVAIQAAARGMAARSCVASQKNTLRSHAGLWCALQAVSRGLLLRKQIQDVQRQLHSRAAEIAVIQAHARGLAIRLRTNHVRSSLSKAKATITSLQAATRGYIFRQQQSSDLRKLHKETSKVVTLQSNIRGCLLRQTQRDLLDELWPNEPQIIQLQALTRAMLVRLEVGDVLTQLDEVEHVTDALQAAARGKLVREKFVEKKRFYKENMEKVVKVQSFIRGKLQGEAYKSLTSGKNPPVGTVKGFVHLLNDSDFDFDEEVEFERLRKTVVQHVRQNEMADQYITQLDIKIALLVKNKITLDEVVKHQKHFGGSVGNLLTNTEMASKDPFDLKALNKNSRRKLEHYQELFFMLQTQPQYLARSFKRIREQATPEKECERMKHLIMGLFGYAQKRREEYYLLKLLTRSIKEEVDSCPSIQDYLRGNFFWAKVFSAYIKSPRDRKYMREILGPLVKDNIIDNPGLDLESDPMQIYLSAIENEQLRTGQRSQRRTDIPPEKAIKDEETKRTFIANLQELRNIADQFFAAFEDLLHKMPYGVRYIAQQMFEYLTSRFQHEEPGHILQIVGHWIWKSYLQPALLEPEKFGVVDRGLSQEHKRNLGEVAKLIGQVAAGKLFGAENIFLQPLNSYVTESVERLGEIWGNCEHPINCIIAVIGFTDDLPVITVPDAEIQFDIDEFNDLYAKTKPTLYIKMADIFSIHHIVAADIAYICPSQDDILRDIIREVGSAKNNENELMSVSTSEICLTLNPKLHDIEDPDAEVKALFMETKRCILYIIRVQSGANLMEIMVKPITIEDEDRWEGLVRDELSVGSRKRGAYAEANTMIDIASMSYYELKRTALENILHLEKFGRLTRHNHYQDILNAIAVDIRTKHRRRIQRQRELEGVRLTLARLNDQAVYLEQQLKTYNDYIEQAMVTLQNKKGKKRFLMPFTKQWDHERELQRSGRIPKFGSFKYSAQELFNRGILISWHGYNERQYYQIDLTIASNEVGVFTIEGSSGSIAMPGASAQVPLDDLLQAQFNGTQFLEFFGQGTGLRVSVNLFLHLIMRKFYKDKDS